MFKPLLTFGTATLVTMALSGAAQASIINQHMTPQQLSAYCGGSGAATSSTTIVLPGGRLMHGTVQCPGGAMAVFCGDDHHGGRDDRRGPDDDCYRIEGGQFHGELEHHRGGDDDGHRSRGHGGDDH